MRKPLAQECNKLRREIIISEWLIRVSEWPDHLNHGKVRGIFFLRWKSTWYIFFEIKTEWSPIDKIVDRGRYNQ